MGDGVCEEEELMQDREKETITLKRCDSMIMIISPPHQTAAAHGFHVCL